MWGAAPLVVSVSVHGFLHWQCLHLILKQIIVSEYESKSQLVSSLTTRIVFPLAIRGVEAFRFWGNKKIRILSWKDDSLGKALIIRFVFCCD